jgi:hypothetical protein
MMIRSVGYALSWEYWRRGMYWFVPACAALVVALMAPAYGVLASYADVRAELNHAVFGLVCWGPLVMALASRGFLRRQYTLPVQTGTLVGWTLANGSLAVAIAYWLVALGFNTLFHAEWPLWGPAWWAVVVYAIFQAAVWSVAGGRCALPIAIVYLALLTAFVGPPNLNSRLVPVASDTGTGLVWPTLTAAELAASLAVVAGFYLAAVYVVGRDRRGDGWTLAWLSPAWWTQRVGNRVSAAAPIEFTPRSFRSPRAAQFWMEWRSKGRYVVLYVAATVAVLWVFAALNDHESVSTAMGGLSAMLLLISPLAGVYLGHRSERFDMKPFLATRPLSDGEQATVVLGHAGLVSVVGTIIWLIGVTVTLAICAGIPDFFGPPPTWPTWHHVAAAILYMALVLGGFLVLIWALVALGASLAMARSWFVPVGAIGVLAVPFIVAAAQGAPPLAANAASILLAASVLGGTVAAFVAAWQRRLVSRRTVTGALVAYILLLACFVPALGEGIMTIEALPRIVGFCAAPLAPLAAAPLALSWNRHR